MYLGITSERQLNRRKVAKWAGIIKFAVPTSWIVIVEVRYHDVR